ncbi:MAG: anti-sigma factor [Alphaproteobacteria bacterium]|nr:anti-sigma factor [Alphaproteobacteria bacterium]
MSDPRFSDETLVAFVDGELDAQTRKTVEAALVSDGDIAARVTMFRQTRTRIRQAYAQDDAIPVPAGLKARIKDMVERDASREKDTITSPPEVIPFTPATGSGTSKRKPPARWIMPMAAAGAFVAVGIGGFFAGGAGQSPPQIDLNVAGLNVAGLDQPGIVPALESLASGQIIRIEGTGDRLRTIASYRDPAGSLCREFEVDETGHSSVVAVACVQNGIWRVQFSVSSGQISETGYAPASSLEALDAYLLAVGAGAPMSLDEEAAALSTLR